MDHSSISNIHDGSDPSLEQNVRRLLLNLKRQPPQSRFLVGSSVGWVAGVIVTRIGKLMVITLGGAIILLQLANENDFLSINWNRVGDCMENVSVRSNPNTLENWKNKAKVVLDYDRAVSLGFLVGLLVGIFY